MKLWDFPMLPNGFRWRVKKGSNGSLVRIFIEHSSRWSRFWFLTHRQYPQQWADPESDTNMVLVANKVHRDFLSCYRAKYLAAGWQDRLQDWENWNV